MPKNSFLKALFKGPKFSIAPIEHNNRGSARIGEVFPVFATVLNPREGIQLDLGHLVRFMPAKAPVMEGYKVTIDAFAVPYSTLGYAERKERDIDDFFNIKQNGGEIVNPFCYNMGVLQGVLINPYADSPDNMTSLSAAFKLGSLGDYINFPSLKAVRDHIRKWLAVNPLAYGNGISKYLDYTLDGGLATPETKRVAEFIALAYLNHADFATLDSPLEIDLLSGEDTGVITVNIGCPFVINDSALYDTLKDATQDTDYFYDFNISDDGSPMCAGVPTYSLLGYILEHYPFVAEYYGYSRDIDDFSVSLADKVAHSDFFTWDYLQILYDFYKIDAQSVFDEWFGYVMSVLLYNPIVVNYDGDNLFEVSGQPNDGTFLPMLGSDEPIDLSYLAAYWKIISDWYINTNIDGDPDDFFLEHCHILTDDESAGMPTRHLDLTPFKRRWSNDVFTSAVPMAQIQNIRIPANGTIPDLREANAYQKLVDIFRNTGNRLRDVVYGVFGITPSAVRSEMSEPIGTAVSWIGMQSVLQTSQTTPDSPQAAYSGIGTDSKGHGRLLKYVNNDEPTPVIIMVLMSVTQRASYMQGFDRKFFRSSIYDFAIPELAMIGEQEVTNKELYFDKEYDSGIFGFNRRYYDWFYMGSEVHGELRDSLDYWHGARIFDEQPALNSEFIGIESGVDHLQRVFANTSESASPIVYNLSFDGYKVVALPRYIQYEL